MTKIDNKVLFLLNKLFKKNKLSKNKLYYILKNISDNTISHLFNLAQKTKEKYYQKDIYLRGLVEFNNICLKNCLYCGIRKDSKIKRFSMTEDNIYNTIINGINLGYNSFVLQSGENAFFDEMLLNLIKRVKKEYKNIAITLSTGEKDYFYYEELRDADCDRFLLRHETINKKVYKNMHQESNQNRINCLYKLKELGFQTGAGFIVGLPGLKLKDYVNELMFLKNFNPHMVGIGPFIASENTTLKDYDNGDYKLTLTILSLIRLLLPKILLPATTALATMNSNGTLDGLKAGCNVIMPNLTPCENLNYYKLYDNKKITETEDGKNIEYLKQLLIKNGFTPSFTRGDYIV